MSSSEIEELCKLNEQQKQLLHTATSKLSLSGRAIHRILKVARTIADLANSDSIETNHLGEAISYRRKTKENHSMLLSAI